ncbi:hypothetical protein M9Y10_020611 [Tritrichomonas musculus]|uniref:WD repeat protein n=1 Tax=Tritrichomonas musculus TaxID=1915356 RepID=A0ABR2HE84_9EUKA
MSESPKKLQINVMFYPPGINIDYNGQGQSEKTIQIPKLLEQPNLSALARRIYNSNKELQTQRFEKIEKILYDIYDSQLINYSDFQIENSTNNAHIMPLLDCQFDKMGNKFVTSSYDRTAKVWDTKSADEEPVATFSGHTGAVNTCRFNVPYGSLVGTGSSDRNAAIWSVEQKKCVHMLNGHTDEVICVNFDHESKKFCSGSKDCTARVWSVETGEILNVLQKHTQKVINVEFHPQEQYLLTASKDSTAILWDLRSNEFFANLKFHTDKLCGAFFDTFGNRIVTGSYDKKACVWDMKNLQKPLHVLIDHTDQIRSVSISIDGKKVATASRDKTARVWSVENGNCICICKGHSEMVRKVQFSPQGNKVVTASDDYTCRIWDSESGKKLDSLEDYNDIIFACSFNYAGNRIITASRDNTVKLWKTRNTKHCKLYEDYKKNHPI